MLRPLNSDRLRQVNAIRNSMIATPCVEFAPIDSSRKKADRLRLRCARQAPVPAADPVTRFQSFLPEKMRVFVDLARRRHAAKIRQLRTSDPPQATFLRSEERRVGKASRSR